MVVAAGCLSVARSRDLGFLVSEEWRSLLERFAIAFPAPERLWLGTFSRRALRPLVSVLEWFTIPGLSLHFVLRKRALEQAVRSALGEGFAQVVVLGGGFDTLALRLAPVFPSADFFELDHPATQRVKARVFHGDVPKNLRFAPVDFMNQSWEEVLRSMADFSRKRDTLFLCEGVLMYLPLQEVEGVFSAVQRSVDARTRFLFTFMELQPDGHPHFREEAKISRTWLRFKGEPFLWGLPPQGLGPFLDERGFSLAKLWGTDALKEGMGIGKSVSAAGEWLALAATQRGSAARSRRHCPRPW